MDDRIDVTKRKPRRLRGTPALKFANRVSLIVLGIGTAIGLIINYQLPFIEDFNKKFNIDLTKVSEKELDKRTLFKHSLITQKSGEEILRLLKEKEKLESER